MLAEGLAEIFPGCVDPQSVETNIVVIDSAFLPTDIIGQWRNAGILAGLLTPRLIRLVTHLDIDNAGIQRTLDVSSELSADPMSAMIGG